MADYVLSAKITGNSASFEKAFQTAQNSVMAFEKRMSSIGSKISGIGNSLTSKITKPAMVATGALAGITLAKGFGRLVGIDTARSKLQALGHDAQSVEKIMDSALASVKGTAFGLDEAATMAANAVAAGIKPGQDLTKYLGMTADAAAIAGVSMSEMGSILNRMQTGQTVYTEDLEQFADRGLPVYQWLAEEAGVAASEVKALASDGKISSEMLFNAINKNIGGAAQIMGETSFTAAVDNIGASLARIGANFLDAGGQGGGFFSQLKPLMAEFNEYLSSIEKKASELGVRFGEAFADMVDDVRNFIANFRALPGWLQAAILKATAFGAVFLISLGPALKIIGGITTGIGGLAKAFGVMKGAGTAVAGLADDINTVRKAFSGMAMPLTAEQQKIANFAASAQANFQKIFAASIKMKGTITKGFSELGSTLSRFGTSLATTAKSAGTSLLAMGTAMKAAIAPFLPAIAIIGALAAAIVYLWKTDDSFRESMVSSWEQIKASFEPVLQSMSTLITQVVQAIMPAVQQLAQAFSQLVPAVMPIIALLAGAFAQILVVVAQTIGQVAQAIAPLVTQLVGTLAPAIMQIVASLAPVISQLVGALAPILTAIGNIITTYIMPAIVAIVGIVANVINTVIQIVTPIITFIANVVGQIISTIASIINTVVSVFNKIYSTVSSVMGRVKSFIINVFNAIKSAWSGLTGFVSKIFGGIAGAVQRLVNTVKGFVNNVIGGINAAIGLINKIPGVSIGKIPYLAHGTNNWQGGFAVMNEGGRGELVSLPNGSQVIPHDVSVKYAKESARANAAAEPLDTYALGAYIVDAVTSQGLQIANGLEKGVSRIRMVPDDRNMARYIGKLGFERK